MNTDELVRMLATGPAAPAAMAPDRRWSLGLAVAAAGALAGTALALGIRADLAQAAAQPMFWMKLAFMVALASIALPAARRLARPGMRLGRLPSLFVAAVGMVWLAAAAVLVSAAPDERAALLLGGTWRVCTLNIALLSVPGLVGLLWVLRGLAPTRPTLAGATVGLLAGSVAAAAYTLHCPETQVPFLAVWYLLGVMAPASAGALLGARLLRW